MINRRLQIPKIEVLEEATDRVQKDAIHEALQSTIPFARGIMSFEAAVACHFGA